MNKKGCTKQQTNNKPALLIRLDKRVWANSSHQELRAEQRQANMLQYLQNIQKPQSVFKSSAKTDASQTMAGNC